MSIDNSRQHKNCFSSALGMPGFTFHKKSIFNMFEKCCVSNYTNGTQNDGLQEQDHEKDLSMSESAGSE